MAERTEQDSDQDLATRLVAVPDTDGDLVGDLRRLEEVLCSLQPWEADDEPALGLDAVALAAFRRVLMTVVAAEREPAVSLLARGGTFHLVPVRFVELADEDLVSMAEALSTLGKALLPSGSEWVADVLREFAASWRLAAGDLVASFARAHGLLDLAPDQDTLMLAGVVAVAQEHSGGGVTLSVEEELAYERLTERALAMFHLDDPLARFLYRGL